MYKVGNENSYQQKKTERVFQTMSINVCII